MLETVAIIGPARFGVPLTQALSAPILGRLHARGVGFWPQLAGLRDRAPAAQRGHHRVLHLGDRRRARRLRRHLRRDRPPGGHRGRHGGRAGADRSRDCWPGPRSRARCRCWCTGAGCGAGTAWPANDSIEGTPSRRRWRKRCGFRYGSQPPGAASTRVRSPRASVVAFVVAACPARSGSLLAAVAAWLALAWLLSRPGPGARAQPASLFAAILAAGAFVFALGGGLGLDVALRRGARAALLVLVATWLRAAAGAAGLREVSRRVLGRLRRDPLGDRGGARCSTRSTPRAGSRPPRARCGERVGESPMRPRALLDAVLDVGGARVRVVQRPRARAGRRGLSVRARGLGARRVGRAAGARASSDPPVGPWSRTGAARPPRGRPGRRRRSSR